MTEQPVSEHASTDLASGETVTADVDGVLVERRTGDELVIDPLPPAMIQFLRHGGLEAHVRARRTPDLVT